MAEAAVEHIRLVAEYVYAVEPSPSLRAILELLNSTPAVSVYISKGYLNVRTGPGTGFGVTGVLKPGTIAYVSEVNGAWAKHQTGWSALSYLLKV